MSKFFDMIQILMLSFAIIFSGCSGLNYGKNINIIDNKYNENYDDYQNILTHNSSSLSNGLLMFPVGDEGKAYTEGLFVLYVILPILVVVVVSGVTFLVIYNN